MRHAAHNRHIKFWHICKFISVVRLGKDGFAKVPSDLGPIHVDTNCKFNVTHMIFADAGMHNTRNDLVVFCALVKLDTLYKRRGAISHTDDGDAYFFVCHEDFLLDVYCKSLIESSQL